MFFATILALVARIKVTGADSESTGIRIPRILNSRLVRTAAQQEKLVSHKFNKPQITQLMYRPKCGLIVGCFRGYIELLDFKVKGDKTVLQRIDFWEN